MKNTDLIGDIQSNIRPIDNGGMEEGVSSADAKLINRLILLKSPGIGGSAVFIQLNERIKILGYPVPNHLGYNTIGPGVVANDDISVLKHACHITQKEVGRGQNQVSEGDYIF